MLMTEFRLQIPQSGYSLNNVSTESATISLEFALKY